MSTFTVLHRWRKSGKSDFAVSANMAYGQVTLGDLGDAGGEYEDPDKLARSVRGGRGGGENYMNQQDVQLPMSSLLVNQRLQCTPQQMTPIKKKKKQVKFIQCLY
ncbi:MAG: hypothetical protein MJE68_03760 [Proteobacteria bacterium]|nr:hypothetical protein [Pseudomonadota bacterium]